MIIESPNEAVNRMLTAVGQRLMLAAAGQRLMLTAVGQRLMLAATGQRLMLAAILTAAAIIGARPAAAQDVGLPIGEVPAAVQIEDLDGNTFDLGSIVGRKPVLIEFWATWCPLCAALEPRIAAAKQKHGDALEVIIVAVGVNQSPRSIRRHIEKHTPPGLLLFDGRGRASRAFRAPTTSYVVALDARGRVVYTGVGEDQDIMTAADRAVGGR